MQAVSQHTPSTQKPVEHCDGVAHAPPCGTGVFVGVMVGVLVGVAVAAASVYCGVSISTLKRWREETGFRELLDHEPRRIFGDAEARLRALAAKAVTVLSQAFDESTGDATGKVRYQAIRSIPCNARSPESRRSPLDAVRITPAHFLQHPLARGGIVLDQGAQPLARDRVCDHVGHRGDRRRADGVQ